MSLPIEPATLKFSLHLLNWTHSAPADAAERWLGFNTEYEFDPPIVLDTNLFTFHTLSSPQCTNGSAPGFGTGPVNVGKLLFEDLLGTYLKVSIPDLAFLDNRTFDCLQSYNSMARDPNVIPRFIASGRRKLSFDLLFNASKSVEYDPDLSIVFGAGYDPTPPASTGSAPSSGSGTTNLSSGDNQIGLIAGIVVAIVAVIIVIFIVIVVRYEPLRNRLSVMQWKTSASTKIARSDSNATFAKSDSAVAARPKSSWSSAKVSAGARDSVMGQ